MPVISFLYKTILEALFPISEAEKELKNVTPENALGLLKRASGYEGLAVPYLNAQSVFAYKDKRVEKLVWGIKYKRSKSAIEIGAYALLRELERINNLDEALIVPMPITSRRRKERGYNQCELIVDEMVRLDTTDKITIEKNLLTRVHHTSRQTMKGRVERVESAKGIFGVNIEVLDKVINKKLHVIVIDDVITTGSTMFEAIETLKKSGFENVSGLSLAH
ncbi:MAG: hypothetical protein RL536_93 [Candidatus Parcubacteria bacterium]|jgi:ComF family protein